MVSSSLRLSDPKLCSMNITEEQNRKERKYLTTTITTKTTDVFRYAQNEKPTTNRTNLHE